MTAATNAPTWEPGPRRPSLGEGAVHVWRADLKTVGEELCELLCDDERERAERVLHERDRRLWKRSRALLRALLARYLQQDARSLRFVMGPHGKPQLAGQADEPQAPSGRPATGSALLPFNLSHSGSLALYAFGGSRAVGVDVELVRRPVNEVAIATRMLGSEEASRLEALEPETRRLEFLRAWVRHEATLKCLGVGIGAGRGTGDTDGTGEPGPWIAQLDLGDDAAAAVAAERQATELRCWLWRP